MYKHAENLEFEEAALVRNEISMIKNEFFGQPVASKI